MQQDILRHFQKGICSRQGVIKLSSCRHGRDAQRGMITSSTQVASSQQLSAFCCRHYTAAVDALQPTSDCSAPAYGVIAYESLTTDTLSSAHLKRASICQAPFRRGSCWESAVHVGVYSAPTPVSSAAVQDSIRSPLIRSAVALRVLQERFWQSCACLHVRRMLALNGGDAWGCGVTAVRLWCS